MAMAGADPLAIMKATGDADMKTNMIYVSLGKSHIRDQVEHLRLEEKDGADGPVLQNDAVHPVMTSATS